MKILVTGGAGMIGLETSRQLLEAGHEVSVFDLGEQIFRVRDHIDKRIKVYYGSILDLPTLREAVKGCEVIIHLAAMLGVQRTEENMLKCIETNINGTQNVFTCAVQAGVRKVVFASSSEIYGEISENPIKEEYVPQGKTVYAVTKLAGEEICKSYKQGYGIEYTILRYFNCYGPFQTAQFVIPKFVLNIKEGLPIEIYGSGTQMRSYTYVGDSARATMLAALMREADSQILNIGEGKTPVSLLDLANMVIRLAGKEGKVKPVIKEDFRDCDRVKAREIFMRYCDSSKAAKILGWTAQTPLEQGIKTLIDKDCIFRSWNNYYH